MMIAPVARFAASAFVLTVASNCARNMLQVAQIRRQLSSPVANPIEQLSSDFSISDCLQTMNRKQLLQVFAHGRAPKESELAEWFSNGSNGEPSYCEWNAKLLDNDGIIMNGSSEILTNQLFGGNLLPWRLLGEASKAKGKWNGKAFGRPTTSKGKGINRFQTKDGSTFLRHSFDYRITESQVLKGGSKQKALRLDYSKYQRISSLWWSMHDEVRVVDASNDQVVMIGMGWMGWSGGALNCSPFLLEQPRSRNK